MAQLTDQQMQQQIVDFVQTDANLMIVLRLLVSRNILNVQTGQLLIMSTALGLPTTDGAERP